jgi:hypothetical protein
MIVTPGDVDGQMAVEYLAPPYDSEFQESKAVVIGMPSKAIPASIIYVAV